MGGETAASLSLAPVVGLRKATYFEDLENHSAFPSEDAFPLGPASVRSPPLHPQRPDRCHGTDDACDHQKYNAAAVLIAAVESCHRREVSSWWCWR